MHQTSAASIAETSAVHTPYNRSQYHSHGPAKEKKNPEKIEISDQRECM